MADPLASSGVAQIQQLIAKWRLDADSDDETKTEAEGLQLWVRAAGFKARAEQRRADADELEAALLAVDAPPVTPQNPMWVRQLIAMWRERARSVPAEGDDAITATALYRCADELAHWDGAPLADATLGPDRICEECGHIFTAVQIEAEDPTAWGHPCYGTARKGRVVCESHRPVVAVDAPPPQAEEPWQDISTYSGHTYELLFSPAHSRVIGAHVTGDVWHLVGVGCVTNGSERPTHWMPLPNPPTVRPTRQEGSEP